MQDLESRLTEVYENRRAKTIYLMADGGLRYGPPLFPLALVASKDVGGHEVVREMLEKKQGVLDYLRPSAGGAEEVIAVYSHFPGWNWLIVGETPTKEVFEVSNILRGELFMGAAAVALVLSGLLYLPLKRTIPRRLSRAVGYARQVSSGDLSTRIRSRHGIINDSMSTPFESFERPCRRSTKIIGTSSIRHPRRTASKSISTTNE